MKIFVDTNIFLDLILKRENYKEALLIFNAVEKNIFEAYILDITLLNIDYIAKKQIKEIKDFLELVNNNFKVIGGTNIEFKKALEIDNNDLEDNLQYIGAKKSYCDVIITNDTKFYSKNIKKFTSLQFISEYL